jgi:gluconate:H+ symporter, GntP family
MDPLPAFLAAVILVSILVPKMGPFLSLVLSAILYGLVVGMGFETMSFIATGLGRTFSSLAVVVFSGAVLAEYLRKTGAIDRIVADLLGISKNGLLVSGAAGYLISLPVMCSITAFMILEPVVNCLGRQTEGGSRRLLFMTAVASVISFNLIYPSPVMVSLAGSLDVAASDLLSLGVPVSLLLFALAYIYMSHLPSENASRMKCLVPEISRLRAWLPLLLPMGLILMGVVLGAAPGDVNNGITGFIGNPGLALLLGALVCLFLAREKMQEMVHTATRRSGTILLDLCGAGAFGYVVAQSELGQEIYSLGQALPILVLPFLISSVLQLAQGSRVVTAVVAAQVLADYPLDGLTMALLISAGAFMFSYVSDPYFWLIKESTGANMNEMVRGYTFPLSLMGLAAFAAAAIYSAIAI